MLSKLVVAVAVGLVLSAPGVAPGGAAAESREQCVTVRSVAARAADGGGTFHFRIDRPAAVRLAYAWYAVAPDGGRVRLITCGFWADAREPAGALDYTGRVRADDGKLVLKDRLFRTAAPVPALFSGDGTHHGFDGVLPSDAPPRAAGGDDDDDGVRVGAAYRAVFAVDLVRDGRTVDTLCLAISTAGADVTLDDLDDDLPRPNDKGDRGDAGNE